MRSVTHLVIAIVIAAGLSAPAGDLLSPHTVLAAHCSSRGDTYAQALAAKAHIRAAALAAARRAATREREARRIAEETARFGRLYGAGVGRWYPLVHRWFPGHEGDALYVMHGESGGDPYASNGTCWSLWQIHECHARKFREVTGHGFFWGVLVPAYSAEMTAHMTRGGIDWSSWSVRP